METRVNMSCITKKGQIVIPAAMRRRAGLRAGTRVYFQERNGDIVIRPESSRFYDHVYGFLKGAVLVESLQEVRAQERRKTKRSV